MPSRPYNRLVSGYRPKKSGSICGHVLTALDEMPRGLRALADHYAEMPIGHLRASWVAGIIAVISEDEEHVDLGNLARCLIAVDVRLDDIACHSGANGRASVHEPNPWDGVPVSEFDLSSRISNTLARNDVETVGDLTRKSADDLISYRGFGDTALSNVIAELKSRGLRLLDNTT